MLFKTFSRVFVLVSLCALFAAVASKPARLSRQSLERHIAHRAVTGTKTLKQYDARAPHTHTRAKRQASPAVADRIATTPEDNQDQDQQAGDPSPGATPGSSNAAIGVVQGPSATSVGIDISIPTGLTSGLSRRHQNGPGIEHTPRGVGVDTTLPNDLPEELGAEPSVADITGAL